MKLIPLMAAAALLLTPATYAQEKKAADKPAAPTAKSEKAAVSAKPEAAPLKEAAKPPAKEVAKPEAAPAKEAMKPEAKPAPEKVAAKRGPSRANEDARTCLGLGTNTEIIKCAEKFL